MTLLQKLMAHAGLNPAPVQYFPEVMVGPLMPFLSPELADAVKRASSQRALQAEEAPARVWGRHQGVFVENKAEAG